MQPTNLHITRINNWLTCKRAGYLNNHYEPKYTPDWARTGTHVHAAIAHHTAPEHHTYPADIDYRDTFSQALFEHYIEWLADNSAYAGKVISTEHWQYTNEVAFTVPWLDTVHSMQGHIDSIVYDGATGQTYLLEYKTTGNLVSRAEAIFNELQPIWYTLAAQQLGYHIDKIIYHLIRKKVPGTRANADTTKYWLNINGWDATMFPKANIEQNYFMQVVVPIERYDLDVWSKQLAAIVDDYVRTQPQYPTFGHHCRWCQFSDVCNLLQRKDTAHLAETMLRTEYSQRRPH